MLLFEPYAFYTSEYFHFFLFKQANSFSNFFKICNITLKFTYMVDIKWMFISWSAFIVMQKNCKLLDPPIYVITYYRKVKNHEMKASSLPCALVFYYVNMVTLSITVIYQLSAQGSTTRRNKHPVLGENFCFLEAPRSI